MKELLKKFENKQPEIVFEWSDSESEAEGWVVINSLRGGAAGGGTRMRKGLDKREVESLAKTMEIKFTVSGPSIGGAKSGINFDPSDPRKDEVLKRWYRVVMPLLKNYYGTGGDLNIDEINEVIPITESYGLWHPQEGVVNGHYHATEPEKIRKIGQLRQGVSKVLEDPLYTPNSPRKYKVADMITGFGVAEAVRHYYKIWGGNINEKRAVIQGWGNVGAAAACFLAVEGVRIVGIIDREGGLINEEGFSLDEIRDLFVKRNGNKLFADNLLTHEEINRRIWDLESEIFIPAAASRLIDKNQAERMVKSGLEVISCGANVPFADTEIFFGPIGVWVDEKVSLIPDFIANCGMARVFAYLMSDDVVLTDEAIFTDVSKTISEALKKTYEKNPGKTGLALTSLEIALKQLV
ncbi:Glu/Leu/Phe/Val dehydrogenase dimerization domain-containing protein [Aquiflexum sp.]|uniref:Glu/Leu/Phe/Val dehydrogenase dimerization domain-containing protein n=1 Tax=Aquiflexum sp. TaxID=1872584 RepID=UPI003592F733